MSKTKVEYRLDTSYPNEHYTLNFDIKLEKAVGTDCSGGGCGLGFRDLDFSFKSFKKASEAFSQLESFYKKHKIKNVELSLSLIETT